MSLPSADELEQLQEIGMHLLPFFVAGRPFRRTTAKARQPTISTLGEDTWDKVARGRPTTRKRFEVSVIARLLTLADQMICGPSVYTGSRKKAFRKPAARHSILLTEVINANSIVYFKAMEADIAIN